MNKFFCLMLCAGFLQGACSTSLEVRSGAFIHTPDRFQTVYSKVGPFVGGEAVLQVSNCYGVWLDVDYFRKSGGCSCNTSVRVINASFGLRGNLCLCSSLQFYAGVGPAFGRMHLHNHTPCIDETFIHTAVGGVVKSGFLYSLPCCYFLDIFADYLYQPVTICRRFDIGGVKVGAAIGRRF